MWKDKKIQEKQGQQQILGQEQISARSWKTAHELLVMTTEFLEKYIEKAGYYSDWEQRKQIHDNRVQRNDGSPEEAEKSFSTMLFLFGSNLEEKPSELREKLKERFYQWIDATGIDVNNCPERLKHVLFGINEIMEGRSEKIFEDVKNAKREYEVGSSEYSEALNAVFTGTQNPMDKLEEEEKDLEGKDWKQITLKNKFDKGNDERGKQTFSWLAQTVSNHGNFHFFPQKQQVSINSGKVLTDKIKQNLHEWKIKEVVVFKGHFGGKGEVRELALVHQEANLKSYNWQGYLEVDSRMVYFKKDHQAEEWVQIEQYYFERTGSSNSIQTISPQQRTNSEIIQDIKQSPSNWRIDEVITEYGDFGRATNRELALIHSSAQVSYDGAVSDEQQPVYLAKRFSSTEIAEIERALNISQTVSTSTNQPKNYFSKVGLKAFETSQPQKNNDNTIGTGGIIAFISVASLAVIGSLVAVKNKFNKKKR